MGDNHACWQLVPTETNDDRVTIRDVGPWDQKKTITNDAEYVVATLVNMLKGRPLFYYDSQEELTQLKYSTVNGLKFLGFSAVPNAPEGFNRRYEGDWPDEKPTGVAEAASLAETLSPFHDQNLGDWPDERATSVAPMTMETAIATAYGVCPYCGGLCKERERRPDGDDVCENGHTYPSRNAVPVPAPESTDPQQRECGDCGFVMIDPDAKYCCNCGGALPAAPMPYRYAMDVLVDSRAVKKFGEMIDRVNEFMHGCGFNETLIVYVPLTCVVTSTSRKLRPAELSILHKGTCDGFEKTAAKLGYTFKVEPPRLITNGEKKQ